MISRTIKYTDYNGVERNETFYFNLTEAEIVELEMSTTGGFTEMLKRIVELGDAPSIIRVFKEMILKAYGEKAADGKHFVKSEAISTAFSQTEAYSNLFMELLSNTDEAIAFFNELVPKSKKQPMTLPETAKQ